MEGVSKMLEGAVHHNGVERSSEVGLFELTPDDVEAGMSFRLRQQIDAGQSAVGWNLPVEYLDERAIATADLKERAAARRESLEEVRGAKRHPESIQEPWDRFEANRVVDVIVGRVAVG